MILLKKYFTLYFILCPFITMVSWTGAYGQSQASDKERAITRRNLQQPGPINDTILRMSTGPISGSYYAVGKTISFILSNPQKNSSYICDKGIDCGVSGLVLLVRNSRGSIANIKYLKDGDTDLALAQSDIASWAFYGTEAFTAQKPFKKLRAIGYLFPSSLYFITRKDSSIKTFSDIIGKRIAIGMPQSETLILARSILRGYDILETELQPQYISFDQGTEEMISKKIDGMFLSCSVPSILIKFLSQQIPINILPFSEDARANSIKTHPGIESTVIPENTYTDIKEIQTISTGTLLLAKEELNPNIIYNIAQTIWSESNQKLLQNAHNMPNAFTPQQAINNTVIPLHDGALKYYQDMGLN